MCVCQWFGVLQRELHVSSNYYVSNKYVFPGLAVIINFSTAEDNN